MMRAGASGAVGEGAGRQPTPHRVVNPEGLAPPVGFAHAVVAAPGRTVYLGGQAAQGPDGAIAGATLAEQFDLAAGNLVAARAAAGGAPEHLVSLHVYTTEVAVYPHQVPTTTVDDDDHRLQARGPAAPWSWRPSPKAPASSRWSRAGAGRRGPSSASRRPTGRCCRPCPGGGRRAST